MTEQNQKLLKIRLDSTSSLLNTAEQIESEKQLIRDELEMKLPEIIERKKELPTYVIHQGKYANLLDEARELYIFGKFYSCVAMCGITAERIAKELLRAGIFIRNVDEAYTPNDEQFKQINRIDMITILNILKSANLIDEKTSFFKLTELRNKYAHGAGENEKDDAKQAIEYLHKIVEGTVSVFKHYKITEQGLTEKN